MKYNHSAVLAGVRASSSMKTSYQSLLKAHMDYLLMTSLLMIFYLLFAHFHVSASPVILTAMCLGSLGSPVGFLVLAVSFALTTVGYARAAYSVGHAALVAQ